MESTLGFILKRFVLVTRTRGSAGVVESWPPTSKTILPFTCLQRSYPRRWKRVIPAQQALDTRGSYYLREGELQICHLTSRSATLLGDSNAVLKTYRFPPSFAAPVNTSRRAKNPSHHPLKLSGRGL